MPELLVAPEVESIEPPPIVEAPAATLVSVETDGNDVLLRIRVAGLAAEPLLQIQQEIGRRLESWRETSAAWAEVNRVQLLLSSALRRSGEAGETAVRADAQWRERLAVDGAESEEADYREARREQEIAVERVKVLQSIVQEKRKAAEQEWRCIRMAHLTAMRGEAEQLVAAGRTAIAALLDGGRVVAAYAQAVGIATALQLRAASVGKLHEKP